MGRGAARRVGGPGCRAVPEQGAVCGKRGRLGAAAGRPGTAPRGGRFRRPCLHHRRDRDSHRQGPGVLRPWPGERLFPPSAADLRDRLAGRLDVPPPGTEDPGALLPGCVLVALTITVMHAVSELYLPDGLDHASQLYGAFGTTVVTLGWFSSSGGRSSSQWSCTLPSTTATEASHRSRSPYPCSGSWPAARPGYAGSSTLRTDLTEARNQVRAAASTVSRRAERMFSDSEPRPMPGGTRARRTPLGRYSSGPGGDRDRAIEIPNQIAGTAWPRASPRRIPMSRSRARPRCCAERPGRRSPEGVRADAALGWPPVTPSRSSRVQLTALKARCGA